MKRPHTGTITSIAVLAISVAALLSLRATLSRPRPHNLKVRGAEGFVPRAQVRAGKAVLTVTFPDASTADVSYPAPLSIAGLGVSAHGSGGSVLASSKRSTRDFDVVSVDGAARRLAGRAVISTYQGTASAKAVQLLGARKADQPASVPNSDVAVLWLDFGSWKVLTWDYVHASGQENTNQENTNQENANQENTNQENTNQENTNQENTNQENTNRPKGGRSMTDGEIAQWTRSLSLKTVSGFAVLEAAPPLALFEKGFDYAPELRFGEGTERRLVLRLTGKCPVGTAGKARISKTSASSSNASWCDGDPAVWVTASGEENFVRSARRGVSIRNVRLGRS